MFGVYRQLVWSLDFMFKIFLLGIVTTIEFKSILYVPISWMVY